MIHRLNVFLLSLIVVFAPVYFTTAYASAAEKWEYEPVMKDMNIHVKGYKVDQYGNAVNDYEYNTKIDPKTTVNKQKMGTVGFGRLLKTTGWGLLGSAALEALLEAVDWVIDPESQSIWRNKSDAGGSVGCSGGFLWQYRVEYVSCPIDAINLQLRKWEKEFPGQTYEFVRFDIPDIYTAARNKEKVTFTFRQTFTDGKSVEKPLQQILYKPDPNAQPVAKEYLTPEALADYANHTHPDYADPQLAPKLQPKYSPNIASDLWKPSNNWEKDNSPTVQEVNNQLDKTNPEPIKPPEITPNPETGGSVLPSFCSWAVPVCEAINWFKETPDLQDKPLNIEEKQVIDYEHINYVQFGASCPFSPQSQSLPMGVLGSIDFQTDLTFICNFGVEAKPYIVGLGHLGALIFLLIGIRNGNG